MSRNTEAGLNTDVTTIKIRILQHLQKVGRNGSIPSVIGYQVFVGYIFRSPQAAAFAVSKHLFRMKKAGLIGYDHSARLLMIRQSGLVELEHLTKGEGHEAQNNE